MKLTSSLSLLASTQVAAAAAASVQHPHSSRRVSRRQQQPAIPCESITAPDVQGATVVSIAAAERRNVPMSSFSLFPGAAAGPGSNQTLNFCDVNVTLTHGNNGDRVRVEVWLPLQNWNGRFQGTGGGGFIAGTFGVAMAPQVAAGYAAASTDAGITLGFDGAPLLANSPNVGNSSSNARTGASALANNQQLLTNFASLSVHEMAVVGKAVTASFYGRAASFAYWNGCSTGGRQGMSEAQMYPEDFDGILAEAPAINWPQFVTSGVWPFAVTQTEGEVPSACVLDFLTQAAVVKCDLDDGARDQLISDPVSCSFDPKSVVGRMVNCNGVMTQITERQATSGSPATLAGRTPFSISANWVDDFVIPSTSTSSSSNSSSRNSNLSVAKDLNITSFAAVFAQAVSSNFAAGRMLATNNPDLSGFRDAGGKILTWHGLADQLIFPEGTFSYRRQVEARMDGGAEVDSFYRVFSAPGVQHCAGGNGPQPSAPLDALVAWVENGQAPDTLAASRTTANGTVTRNLCRYPMSLRYRGSGDINKAESWTCSGNGTSNSIPADPIPRVSAALSVSSPMGSQGMVLFLFSVLVWVWS